jgi:uncharacterized protein (TIRG00374 family)
MSDGRTKRHLGIWLVAFVIWLLIMAAVLYVSGLDQSVFRLTHINLFFLSLAVLAFVFQNVIYGLNWNMLAHFMKIKIKLRSLFQIMLVGLCVDDLLPSVGPGGEFMMGYLLHKKSGAPLSKSMATVVIQMISWFVGFIVLAVCVLAFLLSAGEISMSLAWLLVILLIIFSAILATLAYLAMDLIACEKFVSKFAMGIVSLARHFLHIRIKGERSFAAWIEKTICEFHSAMKPFRDRKSVLILSFTALTLYHFFGMLSFWLFLLAFGIQMSVAVAFLVSTLTILISLLTFTPGGLGTFEVAGISFVSASAGVVSGTIAISAYRLMQYWAIVFTGGFFAIKMGIESLTPWMKK